MRVSEKQREAAVVLDFHEQGSLPASILITAIERWTAALGEHYDKPNPADFRSASKQASKLTPSKGKARHRGNQISGGSLTLVAPLGCLFAAARKSAGFGCRSAPKRCGPNVRLRDQYGSGKTSLLMEIQDNSGLPFVFGNPHVSIWQKQRSGRIRSACG